MIIGLLESEENALPPTDQGKTLIHEIGHYLGLSHMWHEGACVDDKVEDTPIQATSYLGCPEFPSRSCGSVDMNMNFMDYVNDECMHMFTEGQMLPNASHTQYLQERINRKPQYTLSFINYESRDTG